MKINLKNPTQIIFFIVLLPVLSIGLTLGIGYLLKPVSGQWYSSLIDSLGFLGSYAFLYGIFDNYLWQFTPRIIRLVTFPNLNGRWKGAVTSSFNGHSTEIPAFLEIRQSFSKIKVCLYTNQSCSYSILADFIQANNGEEELHYEYCNEPGENADSTMHAHNGSVRLHYLPDKKILEGSYYNVNSHERGHTGSLSFKLQSQNLRGKF